MAFEQTSAAAWLTDETSHTPLASAINPSLGLAQIKPLTALTALRFASGDAKPMIWLKHARDLPHLDWPALGSTLVTSAFPVEIPTGKRSVIEALSKPELNLRFCAFVLDVHAARWATAEPESKVRDRPEILATLYQLGFERSRPHRNPAPNEFGREVARVAASEWMRATVD